MTFDLENAIQQGINVNPTTHDKQIESNNLFVQLGDPDGYGAVNIVRHDNGLAAVITSDGYMSIAGKSEVHGGLETIFGTINTKFLTLQNGGAAASVFLLNQNPNGTITGTKGSLGLNDSDGYLYVNRDGAVNWARIPTACEVPTSTTFIQKGQLELNAGMLNGTVNVDFDGLTPALDYKHNSFSKAVWTLPVPADWDHASNININLYWSPADSAAGNIVWKLESKSLALGGVVSGATTALSYTQSVSGTTDALQTTNGSLNIPFASVGSTDQMLTIAVERDGKNALDTYSGVAQVHMIQYSYTAKNII